MSQTRLDPNILLRAYMNGYFPMPDPETGSMLWFNPDPRAIIPLNGFHLSKSLARKLRQNLFHFSTNRDFAGVIAGCADREDTWINAEIQEAYTLLQHAGFAHSIEVWQNDALVGGLYGVSLGGAFFAESKFHRVTDASKAALAFLVAQLVARGYHLLEVQFLIPHLESLGAIAITKADYMARLQAALVARPLIFERPSEILVYAPSQ